jgi:glycosyltransferase involved in cell wall biosynthesis
VLKPPPGDTNVVSMNSTDIDALSAHPLISVCVPVYNNGATIARCLRSIVDQDGDFEILVVDDCSSDDSVLIAATMLRPGDRLISNESNLGQFENHQRCLELARGRYIQFVHCDDYLLPGALQTLARFFDDPTVGIAFAPRRVVTDDLKWLRAGGTLHSHFRKLDEHNDGLSLVRQMALAGFAYNWIGEPTSVMFRRRVALDAGGIRTECPDELELWLRLLLRSSACFFPEELSVRHQRVITEDVWASCPWWLNQLRMLTWMILDPASPPDIRIIAGMWWPLAWLGRAVYFGIKGPDRSSRLKILVLAPFREFAHARRLRQSLVASSQAAT